MTKDKPNDKTKGKAKDKEKDKLKDSAKERAGKKEQGKAGRAKRREHLELGRRGEEAAALFLERQGMTILARNYTCEAGEADIIALDGDALHFVEVKTRKSVRKGFPEEHVSKEKRRRYERIAESFLREYDGFETRVTFDIVSIIVTGSDHAFLRMIRNVLSTDCRG